MKYITTIVDSKYMSVGGFGHIFYDVLSSYIIAKLFGLKFVYSPMNSLGELHHTGQKPGYTGDIINWDTFLNFGNGEINIENDSLTNLKRVHINLCKPFTTMDIVKLEKFIQAQEDDTLFILTNNNRIYLNELYYFNLPLAKEIHSNIRSKLEHLRKSPNQTTKIQIAMHIRRGDWSQQPLSYNKEFIRLLQEIKPSENYTINVYSMGKEHQLKEVRQNIQDLNSNIVFHFNTDIYETFSGIYNADIVVGGHSNFPKIITMFSNNVFIYLPYKDGIIPALGTNKDFKLYHHGKYPELFDEENRVETDIYCKKNRELIIKKLSNL